MEPKDGNSGEDQINRNFFYPFDPPCTSRLVASKLIASSEEGLARQWQSVDNKELVELPLNWPPPDWEDSGQPTPIGSDRESVHQWFDFYLHPAGPLVASGVIENRHYSGDFRPLVRNAIRLAFRMEHREPLPELPDRRCSPFDAQILLRRIRGTISEKLNGDTSEQHVDSEYDDLRSLANEMGLKGQGKQIVNAICDG